MSNEWQPIETAPKDSNLYLILHNDMHHNPEVGGWVDSMNSFWTHRYGFGEYTHWLQIPKPPTQ